MVPNELNLGEKIKYYRSRRGISQLDLEIAIDTSPGALSRIETNKVNPTKETLLKISRILMLSNIETASLFGIIIEVPQYL